MDPSCADLTGCVPTPKNLGNWINYDPVLSIGADVLIALVVLVTAYIAYRYYKYLKRPFCVDCRNIDGKNIRTKYHYKMEEECVPVCENHWFNRKWEAEPEVKCPMHSHNVTCSKEWSHRRIVHRCPECNTVIAPDGRYDEVLKKVTDSNSGGFWTTWWFWWIIGFNSGMAMGKSMHS